MKYEDAKKELDEILEQLETDQVAIDDLESKVVRAKELVLFCQKKLRDIGAQIEKVSNDDE